MSRIQGTQHTQIAPNFGGAHNQPNATTNSEQNQKVYVANNDSAHEKFCAHEGIDRGRGHKHDLHGKKAGDKVEIIDGTANLTGTVLKDTGDSLLVLVGDQVYTVEKETGKSRCHRKASDKEMQQYAQMQQEQQEQARIQEQQSARVDESIKLENKKYDTHLYDQKIELRADDLKKIEGKKKAVQSLSNEFSYQAPKTEHQSLTVAEIILNKDKENELKK